MCADVCTCLCASIFVEEKVANVGAQDRKGFKMRLLGNRGNCAAGHFLPPSPMPPAPPPPPPLFLGSGFWISSASLPWLKAGGGALGRENWNHITAGSLAYMQRGQSLGLCSCPGGCGHAERGGHEWPWLAQCLTSGPVVPGTGCCGRKT